MSEAKSFSIDATIESFVYEKASDSWRISFSRSIVVSVDSVWRLLMNQKTLAVSTNHDQWFGLTSPLNLTQEVINRLKSERLKRIEIMRETGDLHLTFTGDYVMEVLITSVNYECYELLINGERHIATGGGV